MGCAPPFGRRARRRRGAAAAGDAEPDEWSLARAAEAIAKSYGWGPPELERLTDEQLVLYLDAAQDRIDADVRNEFESWVEAVRIGTFFGSGTKEGVRQYARWKTRARNARPGRKGLTGAALESAVMRIAEQFPDQVVRGPAE